MSDRTCVSSNSLVAGMKNGQTTQDWDIVVSYSILRLNTILTDLWGKGAHATQVEWEGKTSYGVGSDRRRIYKLTLQAPKLSFTHNNFAQLVFPLSGSTKTATFAGIYGPEVHIPSGYGLWVAVPLTSVFANDTPTVSRVIVRCRTSNSSTISTIGLTKCIT